MDIETKLAALSLLPRPPERRRRRENAGVTQAELAASVGVHQTTVMRWERGEADPHGEHLTRYVDLLLRLSALSAASS